MPDLIRHPEILISFPCWGGAGSEKYRKGKNGAPEAAPFFN